MAHAPTEKIETQPLRQNVSRIICWIIHEDGARSVEDLLELPCSVAEAPHYYSRYWGQHGVHSGPVQLEAGYTLDDGIVVWPFAIGRRRAAEQAAA